MEATIINTNFLQEWINFGECHTKVKKAMRRHFMKNVYWFQASHDPASQELFLPSDFKEIDDVLGLAFTSTSSYAALWTCNSGYLFADKTHWFIGFAINENWQVVGIAQDQDENEIYIIC